MDRGGTIWSMNDSMAHADSRGIPLDVPRWRVLIGWGSALLLAALFFVSGVWKLGDPEGAAVRMAQARVPEALTLAAALSFGITETVAAAFLVVPRHRRAGAVLSGLLLVSFLVWFAIHYSALQGEDCSCFPWLKRVVGPGFFIGDALMLALAAAAGMLAPRFRGRRSAALIVGSVTVFALVSWGVVTAGHTGTRAPGTILVEGQPYSLQGGRVLLYFFDPQCMHCFDAAQKMSTFRWRDTRIVGVPISTPQYAPQFSVDTGFKMAFTNEHARLKQVFPYASVPAAVTLENGRQTALLVRFEGDEPAATLKRLGLIE